MIILLTFLVIKKLYRQSILLQPLLVPDDLTATAKLAVLFHRPSTLVQGCKPKHH